MRATLAGGAIAGRRRIDETLSGRRHFHLVQDAVVGGDNELFRIKRLRGGDQL